METLFNELDALSFTIQSLREDMVYAGVIYGLSSEKTIQISQHLDFYIAKYQNLKNKSIF